MSIVTLICKVIRAINNWVDNRCPSALLLLSFNSDPETIRVNKFICRIVEIFFDKLISIIISILKRLIKSHTISYS